MEKERNRTKQAVFRLLKTKVGEELMAAVFISESNTGNKSISILAKDLTLLEN